MQERAETKRNKKSRRTTQEHGAPRPEPIVPRLFTQYIQPVSHVCEGCKSRNWRKVPRPGTPDSFGQTKQHCGGHSSKLEASWSIERASKGATRQRVD